LRLRAAHVRTAGVLNLLLEAARCLAASVLLAAGIGGLAIYRLAQAWAQRPELRRRAAQVRAEAALTLRSEAARCLPALKAAGSQALVFCDAAHAWGLRAGREVRRQALQVGAEAALTLRSDAARCLHAMKAARSQALVFCHAAHAWALQAGHVLRRHAAQIGAKAARTLRSEAAGRMAPVLMAAGIGGLIFWGAAHAWALYYERRESALLAAPRVSPAPRSARVSPPPDSTRRAALRRAAAGGAWGRLEIDRLKLSALIAEGADKRTLSVAVGHIEGSAFPGERGTVALAGHRDTHLRGLRNVRIGDQVRIVTPEAGFDYVVEATYIVRPERVDLIRAKTGRRLALVTCYPFGYIGPAPYRMVVHARPAHEARHTRAADRGRAGSAAGRTAPRRVRLAIRQ
jgi:sortase A